MKTIHHGQRQHSKCWLRTGGNVLGFESHTRDTAGTHRMRIQPLISGQGSVLVATEVLVPLTSRSSPCEPLSPLGCRAQQGRFHADWGCFPALLWRRRQQVGGRRARIGSPRSSPRALGTSNPALLHFSPPRSTEELSNDQLRHSQGRSAAPAALNNTRKSRPTAARWPWQAFPATCLGLSDCSHTSQLQHPQAGRAQVPVHPHLPHPAQAGTGTVTLPHTLLLPT